MNAPTLIVGLGGTGSKVALKVADMVTNEQRRNIGFAVFDTDVNDLKGIKDKYPFVHTIQTSTNLTVGEYLDIDKHSRDTWFPINKLLNPKTLTEGAGQVRAVSRIAFETAVRAGKMEELHKAIEELYKLETGEYKQALRVIIVSSLAGGTGSGILLPVALYIRNYLMTRLHQSGNITRGFFLLPEIFYGVIQGQAERNNLKSNAYATLRELDAFMMKGDATLPKKYSDSVKIEFPIVGSDEFEEFNIRPYDFCFLFDALSTEDGFLNSFEQYLNHAANCIYAQSIGPMNKRSNSSEDNTIRKLCAESGRNRYAGAGTSMLIYPTEDIKKFLSLSWAKNCVSDQWLMFDKQFEERYKENEESRRNGERVADIKLMDLYGQLVEEQETKHHNPFATAIHNACTTYDTNGVTKLADSWITYTAALKNNVLKDFQDADDDISFMITEMHTAINGLSEIDKKDVLVDSFVEIYGSLSDLKGLISKKIPSKAENSAYVLFRSKSSDVLKEKSEYNLETYLTDESGKLIHPCAIRYFLYKVYDQLSLLYKDAKINLDNLDKNFQKFAKDTFDNRETEGVEETVDQLGEWKNLSLRDKLTHRLGEFEEVRAAYVRYLDNCKKLRDYLVLEKIYKSGMDYVKSISDAYEILFKSLAAKIAHIEVDIKDIKHKYDDTKGTAARYVCASSKCLDALLENTPYLGGVIEIDDELSKVIYSRVREYAMLTVKADNIDYFSDVFDVDIIKYFTDSLMKRYGDSIDMDIFSAIEREAEYEEGIVGNDEVIMYTTHVFDEAKSLAAPFIEKPSGEEKEPINSCTFNDKLYKHDDSPRDRLIESQLMNFGGSPDADIAKNMILFYKSFYGLRANELSKFSPGRIGKTKTWLPGDYFKAYYELISKIDPVTENSKVITPHIDRWWHNVTMMPDLDEENQTKQKNQIYSAFIWALLTGYVCLASSEGRDRKVYVITRNLMGKEEFSKTLVVPNGTECDCLCEVLDAISIYPEFVRRIDAKLESIFKKEINNNTSLEDSSLMAYLNDFAIEEFPLKDSTKKRSIFDIPLLLKRSMNIDSFDEGAILQVLSVAIDILRDYSKKYCSPQDYVKVVGNLIFDQFKLFLENTEEEKNYWRSIYSDFLFMQICDTVIEALEDFDLDKEARAAVEEVKRKNR